MLKYHLIRRIKYRLGVYNNHCHKSKKYFLIFTFIILTATFFIILHTEKRIGTLAERIAVSQLENDVSSESNRILKELISSHKIDTSSLINAYYSNNKASSLSADFIEINILKTELAEKMTSYINEKQTILCYIPVGSLVSENIFSGYGFNIPVKLIVSGSAFVDFSNSFTSAGINQTKYSIALKITVITEIQTAFNSFQKTIVTELPVTEKIIIGDVPNFMTDVK